MEEEKKVSIKLRCLNEPIIIEKDLLIKKNKRKYIHRVNYKGINYILKRFKIYKFYGPGSKMEIFEADLKSIYEEYFFMKAASYYNPHILKSVFLNCAIKGKKILSLYIDILYEDIGSSLGQLKDASFELIYNLMKQSATVLSLLHNIGKAYLVINSSNILYNDKTEELKFINMGKAFGYSKKAQYKNIGVNLKFELPGKIDLKLAMNAADAYAWQECFLSIILNKNKNLKSDINNSQTQEEKKVNALKNEAESRFRVLVTKLQQKAERYKMSVVDTMEDMLYEMTRTEITSEVDDCMLEKRQEMMVELECGHKIKKSKLITFVLDMFKRKSKYNYSVICVICRSVNKLKALPLDCGGCTWTKFGSKINYTKEIDCDKCEEGMSMTATDKNLIKDYTGFPSTFLMVVDNPKSKEYKELCDNQFWTSSYEYFAWRLKNVKIVRQIDFRERQFTLEEYKTIANMLKTNTTVTNLNLTALYLAPEAFNLMCDVLKFNKTITNLRIASNITKSIQVIRDILKGGKMLKYLYLPGINLSNSDAKVISEALRVNKTLTHLDLSRNSIRTEGANFIFKEVNKTLEVLDLGANNIESIDVELKDNVLIELHMYKNKLKNLNFIKSKTLKVLSLYKNEIDSEEIKAISTITTLESLNLNFNKLLTIQNINEMVKRLKELQIAYNKLNDLRAICEGLEVNTTLIKLSITGNNIRDEEAKFISKGLKANKTIDTLCLRQNKIRYDVTIGEALKVNTSLVELNLSFNRIRDEGARSIGEALKYNTTLVNLHLSNNNIKDINTIGEALKINPTLRQLHLGHNKIKDIKAMSEGLKINRTLTMLSIHNNHIESAKSMIDALKINTTLMNFHGLYNKIGAKEKEVLKSIARLTYGRKIF